jgi:hypothetical protein
LIKGRAQKTPEEIRNIRQSLLAKRNKQWLIENYKSNIYTELFWVEKLMKMDWRII